MPKYGITVVFHHLGGRQETFHIDPSALGNFGIDADTLLTAMAHGGPHANEVKRKLAGRFEGFSLENLEVFLAPYDEDGREVLFERVIEEKEFTAHVERCRSLLKLANTILPPSAREDALDEWMDEIQSAVAEGLPFRRRALSILCRSLPALALRTRLPVRTPRGEG